jgi:hypothetical protein
VKIGTFINGTLNAKDAESQINCLQRYQYHNKDCRKNREIRTDIYQASLSVVFYEAAVAFLRFFCK